MMPTVLYGIWSFLFGNLTIKLDIVSFTQIKWIRCGEEEDASGNLPCFSFCIVKVFQNELILVQGSFDVQ